MSIRNDIEYNTKTGKIRCDFDRIWNGAHFDGPIGDSWAYEYLSEVVETAYCEAYNTIASRFRLKTISPEVVFVSLWNSDKELMELFLSSLGINIAETMQQISQSINNAPKYSLEDNFTSPTWYNDFMKEAELGAMISNKMYITRALSISIVYAFILSNNSVGIKLNESKDFSLADLNSSFVSSVSEHMRRHVESTSEREKWHLYKAPIELEFDPRYGEIQVVPRNN